MGDLALALQHQRLATVGFEQVQRQKVVDLEAALRVRQRIVAEAIATAQQRALAQASRERATLVQTHRETLEHLAVAHQEVARLHRHREACLPPWAATRSACWMPAP